jgi:starch phosphorylase
LKEIYDEKVLTIVFGKRFAGYKRADLLFYDMDRFNRIANNKERPVQIIFAGKPYPMDYTAIGIFDKIVNICKLYKNCSVLVGYEMHLSKLLKNGSDVWLNVPRLTHEACGTSGMAAAMNGAVNVFRRRRQACQTMNKMPLKPIIYTTCLKRKLSLCIMTILPDGFLL